MAPPCDGLVLVFTRSSARLMQSGSSSSSMAIESSDSAKLLRFSGNEGSWYFGARLGKGLPKESQVAWTVLMRLSKSDKSCLVSLFRTSECFCIHSMRIKDVMTIWFFRFKVRGLGFLTVFS